MSDAIFLIRDGALVELVDQPYDSEMLLQRLLADHPQLIAGAQIDRVEPRRWLLVSREMGVPAEEDGSRRRSLDHLYLDQDGIPTLVEVKRSTDTRLRREVVGQMLDYAANAVVHWPVETIRSRYEGRCIAAALDPAVELDRFLDGGAVEDLWSAVKTNLQAGKIRMIFIADIIPPELQRIVEFLNEQMDPAEVLALEIKQYVGEGLQTLVPRVIEHTAEAQRKTAKAGAKTLWTEDAYFSLLLERRGEAEATAARQLFAWTRGKGRLWFGSGTRNGSFGLTVADSAGQEYYLFAAFTHGTVEVYFQWLKTRPSFDDESKRRDLLARLNAIEGVDLPADAIERRPGVPLALLTRSDRLQQFLETLDWVIAQVRASTAIA